ncbi:unnamed protein product [Paramecium primaurelia]|uniref:Uncharacterized protein n=1 Tax=Paramecium primaurelia TaxID=5886 RepID=A0A8S1PNW1_PARPR|nr:unnamed protein product [Paramecium primaurelia]
MIDDQFYQPKIINNSLLQRGIKNEDKIISASYIQVCYDVQRNTIIPLKNVNYHLTILQGLSVVELQQIYSTENYDYPLELEYVFSINENAAVTKMKVELGEKVVYGIIKEKEEAEIEYNNGMNQGKTMVYSEEDKEFSQIKRVRIGQLAPKQELKIIFQYVQPLDVFLNKFWKIDINPIIDNNYLHQKDQSQNQNNQIINYLNSKFNLKDFKFLYKQDIQITFDTGSHITFWKSPTHKLHSTDIDDAKQDGKNNKIILRLDNIPENQNPEKQFTLLFSSDDINLPRAILSHTNNDALEYQKYCATLTFIPKFNQVSLDDAYTQYLDSLSLPYNQVLNRGNYLFFIDRSGSMNGQRIKRAKESLILFLKSLPQDSYFNIISFGNKYISIWNESKQYNQETLDEAIKCVDNMNANMGGTDIYTSLKEMVYNSSYGTSNETILNVFLLTDGEDTARPIIELVQKNNRAETRIYTLGIGSRCNQYLIKRMAEVGNGKFHFVSDNEEINAKVIDLLEDSLTPYLKAFKVETNAIKISSIIPDPESIVSLKKNQELTIQILFSSQQDQDNIQFKINCFDSQDQKQINYNVNLNLNQSKDNEYFHKLAAHKFITYYENALKYGEQQVNFIKLNKQYLDDKDIVNLSVENQILSNKTAFVCEICELEDQFKQQARSKITIQIPQRPKRHFQDQLQWCIGMQQCMVPPQCGSSQIMNMPLPAMGSKSNAMVLPMSQQIQYKCCTTGLPISMFSPMGNLRQEQCAQMKDFPMQTNTQLQLQKLSDIKKDELNVKLSYNQLIQFAQADGSFKISNDIQLKINFNNLNNEQGLKDDVWNTLLILLYLEKYCSEDKQSWQLVFSKSILYLSKHGINYTEKKLEYEHSQA